MKPALEPGKLASLSIEGASQSHAKAVRKVLCAVGIASFGAYLIFKAMDSWSDDIERASWITFFGLTAIFIAAVVPAHRHTYFDFAGRQIVTERHYGWPYSRESRPLTDFSHVVVRHLCHPGGEGPDTYSGSVGLKPCDGTAVYWVRNFPATIEDFPQIAETFADDLMKRTGLPGEPRRVQ